MAEELNQDEKEIIRIYRKVESANITIEKRNGNLTGIEVSQKKHYQDKRTRFDFIDIDS